MKFFDDIDMNNSKFLNAGFESVSTLPTSNIFRGRIVFNSSDNKYYIYITKWIPLVDSDTLDTKIGDISTILASVVEVSE